MEAARSREEDEFEEEEAEEWREDKEDVEERINEEAAADDGKAVGAAAAATAVFPWSGEAIATGLVDGGGEEEGKAGTGWVCLLAPRVLLCTSVAEEVTVPLPSAALPSCLPLPAAGAALSASAPGLPAEPAAATAGAAEAVATATAVTATGAVAPAVPAPRFVPAPPPSPGNDNPPATAASPSPALPPSLPPLTAACGHTTIPLPTLTLLSFASSGEGSGGCDPLLSLCSRCESTRVVDCCDGGGDRVGGLGGMTAAAASGVLGALVVPC